MESFNLYIRPRTTLSAAEVARILRVAAEQVDAGLAFYDNRSPDKGEGISGYVDDADGEEVGYWEAMP